MITWRGEFYLKTYIVNYEEYLSNNPDSFFIFPVTEL